MLVAKFLYTVLLHIIKLLILKKSGDSMNLNNLDDVVPGTTCFNEHRRYNIPCQKTGCRQWVDCKQANNCVLIESSNGPKTLQLVGDIFGITRMRICQIEKKILKKLQLVKLP